MGDCAGKSDNHTWDWWVIILGMVCDNKLGTVSDHTGDGGWPSLAWWVTNFWMVTIFWKVGDHILDGG